MATISEVARHLGVDRDTVKTWTTEFAEHLSLTANPPKGKERQFCETELRVLAFVAELRSTATSVFKSSPACTRPSFKKYPTRSTKRGSMQWWSAGWRAGICRKSQGPTRRRRTSF